MTTSVKIDDALNARIQHLARMRQRSPQSIMSEAIREYVEREEQREHFKQEARDAWTAYQENGLHLTGGEVRDCLNGWGTAEEPGIPECHE